MSNKQNFPGKLHDWALEQELHYDIHYMGEHHNYVVELYGANFNFYSSGIKDFDDLLEAYEESKNTHENIKSRS